MNKKHFFHFLKFQAFISSNALVLVLVVLVGLLSRPIFSLYDNLTIKNQKSYFLDNITKKNVLSLETFIKNELNYYLKDTIVSQAFVFFYLDNYNKRTVFTSKTEESAPVHNTINISKELFYQEMLNYHKNSLCFVKTTEEVYKNYLSSSFIPENEQSPNSFYISCPIFLNSTLIGYIGTITKKPIELKQLPDNTNSVFILTNEIKNSAKNIGNKLSTKQ